MKICLSCDHPFQQSNWKCPECDYEPIQQNDFIAFAPEIDDGFEAQFFELLAANESGHFWFETRNDLLTWALQRYFPTAEKLHEIGCGTGFVLQRFEKKFPTLSLSGSDLFIEGITVAAERVPNAEFYQLDARHIPFKNEFDVIGAFDVLEHIKEDEDVLKQLFSAVKPNGGIILTVPQHKFLWSHVDEFSHHERRYSRRELVAKVRESGFEVVHTTSFMTITLPIMMLSRLLSRSDPEEYDPSTEVIINPMLNIFLKTLLGIEQMLLKTRISLPIGGSLLLIAKCPA